MSARERTRRVLVSHKVAADHLGQKSAWLTRNWRNHHGLAAARFEIPGGRPPCDLAKLDAWLDSMRVVVE